MAMGMKIGPSLTRPKTVIDEGALTPFWMCKTGRNEFVLDFQWLERKFDFREIFPLTVGMGVSYKPRH